MDNLYILTKQEFTSLYRFGQIPLNSKKIIITKNRDDKEINDKIYKEFISLPYFVGDEEYLIISFENVFGKNDWLKIENVSEIIPLTKAAKYSLQMKFDTKLDFKHARFESTVHKVEEEIDIKERFRGAKSFWMLCKVESFFEPIIPNEIIVSAYNKRINGDKSSDFTEDYFIHLLAYDRSKFFPNDSDLGYFYDIGEIFAHFKGKPSFEGSRFHSFIESNKQELSKKSFLELVDIISRENKILDFTKQLTKNGLKEYIASAIFLKFKDDLSERDTIKSSDTGRIIGELGKNKEYINELNMAIYLTGAFFGYKKFYDDLYDLAGLKIFKKKDNQPQKEYSEKQMILDSILKMLDEAKDSFIIENENLESIKKILKNSSDNKQLSKNDVVKILRENFNDRINIEAEGGKYIKYTISQKKGGDQYLLNI